MKAASEGFRLSKDICILADDAGITILHSFSNPNWFARVSSATRLLLTCFSPNHAISLEQGVNLFATLSRDAGITVDRASVLNIVDRLIKSGILVSEHGSALLYTPEMVDVYAKSRAVPEAVCKIISTAGNIDVQTRILDVATGPGSVALQLAKTSKHVTGIDISPLFLNVARESAAERGLNVIFRSGNANKLIFDPATYDVVTLAQAFHWLDPVWATRGVCHVLRQEGQYFAVETNSILPPGHPLRQHLRFGVATIEEIREFFSTQARIYAQWFELLGGPTCRPVLTDRWIVREDRVFDSKFAQAFFFTSQISRTLGDEIDPWAKLQEAFASSADASQTGSMYWHIMRFKNLCRNSGPKPNVSVPEVVEIDEVASRD